MVGRIGDGEEKRLNVLSLFSGCGGMDLGFEGGFRCLRRSVNKHLHPDWIDSEDGDWVTLKRNRFDTVFANDIRPDAKIAWEGFFHARSPRSAGVYHLDSIVDLVKRAKAGSKVFPESVDVVTGGFPCQDFSVAGKRMGFNSMRSHDGGRLAAGEPSVESRGQLYMWMREVVSLVKPLMFVAENVKGLTSLDDVKDVIEHDFANAADSGYMVIPARVLHAADYGVPQSRERVIFFGFKKSALTNAAVNGMSKDVIPDNYNPYPEITHCWTVCGKETLCEPVCCAEAFVGLVEPEFSDDESQRKFSGAKYMGCHCQGQTEVKMNSIGPTIRSEHHGNIEYRRLSREHGGIISYELDRGLAERRLSVRECARIQTFPDDYRFVMSSCRGSPSLSSTDAYKIIGNAVPPLLAYNIARRLMKNWNNWFGR